MKSNMVRERRKVKLNPTQAPFWGLLHEKTDPRVRPRKYLTLPVQDPLGGMTLAVHKLLIFLDDHTASEMDAIARALLSDILAQWLVETHLGEEMDLHTAVKVLCGEGKSRWRLPRESENLIIRSMPQDGAPEQREVMLMLGQNPVSASFHDAIASFGHQHGRPAPSAGPAVVGAILVLMEVCWVMLAFPKNPSTEDWQAFGRASAWVLHTAHTLTAAATHLTQQEEKFRLASGFVDFRASIAKRMSQRQSSAARKAHAATYAAQKKVIDWLEENHTRYQKQARATEALFELREKLDLRGRDSKLLSYDTLEDYVSKWWRPNKTALEGVNK